MHTKFERLLFEVTDNFGSNVVLPCGAYGPRSVLLIKPLLLLPSNEWWGRRFLFLLNEHFVMLGLLSAIHPSVFMQPALDFSGTCSINTFLTMKNFSWITFHESSTLAANFCLLGQFIETSPRKSVFLWYQFHRDVHFFCRFGMTFTWTKDVEKSSYQDQDFRVIVRNGLMLQERVVCCSC